MAENSKIEWTTHTFNPWLGCTHVHAGCTNCYAETLMDTRYAKARWGDSGTRVLTSGANWQKPVAWNKAAEKAGVRARVFCASLADVFEDWQGGRDKDGSMTCHKTGEELSINQNGHVWPAGWPSMGDGDDWGIRPFTMKDARKRLFSLIDATPWLDWLLLTKRPENVLTMWPAVGCPDAGVPGTLGRRLHLRNVWIGTSISDQESADKQVPELLKCRDLSSVLFLSAEPLLGPVDLRSYLTTGLGECTGCTDPRSEGTHQWQTQHHPGPGLDWVIVGGESGHGARPMHPQWVRSIRDQCQAAGVPFFFKQHGEWSPCRGTCGGRLPTRQDTTTELDGLVFIRAGKAAAGRTLDGRTWDEFPEVSR